VSEVIGRTLPYSIFLVGVAFFFAFAIGTFLGMLAAWRRGGVIDSVFTPLLIALGAFPAFFTALVAVYFMGLKWGWFPIQHAYNTDIEPGFSLPFFESVGRHAQLPMLVILGVFTGGWLLSMRNTMINTVNEDYVAMAHAKGLRDRRVMTMYAGRNAILPPLTGFASQFGAAVGGLVFIEFVFSYPGVGLTLQQAALGSDYPLTRRCCSCSPSASSSPTSSWT
jgi:peptide/nickel transport system permease protein